MPESRDRESAYWRELLTRIAEDLEHATDAEVDGKRKAWFSSRAMRIRQRLHESVPEGFDPETLRSRMTPNDHLTGTQLTETGLTSKTARAARSR